MSSSSLLSLSRSGTPTHGPSDDYVDDTELIFRNGVAVGWLALFRESDFVLTTVSDDEEDHPCLFLLTTLPKAKANLEARSSSLSEVIGPPWDRTVELFKNYLNNPRATHVQLDLTEYMEMFAGAQMLQDALRTTIQTLDSPVLSGKKSLFSRSPKMSRGWSDVRKEVESSSKLFSGQVGWALFGSGPQFDPLIPGSATPA